MVFCPLSQSLVVFHCLLSSFTVCGDLLRSLVVFRHLCSRWSSFVVFFIAFHDLWSSFAVFLWSFEVFWTFLRSLSSIEFRCRFLWSFAVFGYLWSSLVVFRCLLASFVVFSYHSRSFAVIFCGLLSCLHSLVIFCRLLWSFAVFGRFCSLVFFWGSLSSFVAFHCLSLCLVVFGRLRRLLSSVVVFGYHSRSSGVIGHLLWSVVMFRSF